MAENKQNNRILSARLPWLGVTASWFTMLILLFGALDSCALGPIRDSMNGLQEGITANRAEIRTTREELRTEFQNEIGTLRADIHSDIESLRDEIQRLDDRYYNHILESHSQSAEPGT